MPRCPANTADQLRSFIACAGFVSCIRLFCGPRDDALRLERRESSPQRCRANQYPPSSARLGGVRPHFSLTHKPMVGVGSAGATQEPRSEETQ